MENIGINRRAGSDTPVARKSDVLERGRGQEFLPSRHYGFEGYVHAVASCHPTPAHLPGTSPNTPRVGHNRTPHQVRGIPGCVDPARISIGLEKHCLPPTPMVGWIFLFVIALHGKLKSLEFWITKYRLVPNPNNPRLVFGPSYNAISLYA
jgi:hypothetical protein